MRNITVSIDDSTYRRSRIRAAELDTSVSALVRRFLESLAQDPVEQEIAAETEHDRRHRLLNEVFEDICATRSGFKAVDNIPREDLHDRDEIR